MYQKILPLTSLFITLGFFIGCGNMETTSSSQTIKLRAGTPSEENHKKAEVSFRDLNFTQALVYDKAQLKEDLNYFREQSAEIALDYNNIALDYAKLKEFNQSLELYKKVIAIDDTVFERNSTERATTFYNIASTYEALTNYKEAHNYYLKSVKIDKNREKLLISYQDIARVNSYEGNNKEALLYYQKARNMALSLNKNEITIAVIEEAIADVKKRMQ